MIPSKLYRKIVELVPIVCVDIILRYEGQYVLVKRLNEPLKGNWWIVGGRAFKGEKTIRTAYRKVMEETGLTPCNLKMVGVYEDSYPQSEWGTPTSSVSIVYEEDIDSFQYKLDKTSSAIKLSDKLPDRFVNKFIKL